MSRSLPDRGVVGQERHEQRSVETVPGVYGKVKTWSMPENKARKEA